MKDSFRVNNFDIIRLFAAFQVALQHSLHYLGLSDSVQGLNYILDLFPGVPIFFFVSGFLISRSYENNPRLLEYSQNRILRIYPALFLCTFLALASVYFTGYFSSKNISLLQAAPWVLSQLTIAQFYTPSFMRDFGVGTLNGSLWTIAVELQFYVMIPLFYWALRLKSRGQGDVKVVLAIVFFVIAQKICISLVESNPDRLLIKLMGVSFVPWFYMFLVGVLFQRNFEKLHSLLAGKAWAVIPLYLISTGFIIRYTDWGFGNEIALPLYLLLAIAVFSVAYSVPNLSRKLFKGNDFSYGVYIYHIPVINIMLSYKLTGEWGWFLLVFAATISLALLSWYLVEKPCLQLKRHPMNPLNRELIRRP